MFYMIHHSLSIFLSKFDMLIRSEAGDAAAATAAGEVDDEEDGASDHKSTTQSIKSVSERLEFLKTF